MFNGISDIFYIIKVALIGELKISPFYSSYCKFDSTASIMIHTDSVAIIKSFWSDVSKISLDNFIFYLK